MGQFNGIRLRDDQFNGIRIVALFALQVTDSETSPVPEGEISVHIARGDACGQNDADAAAPVYPKKYVFMVLSCHILYYINSILFFCTNEMISLRRLLILEASEDLKKEVFVSMKNNYISKMFFCFLYPSKQFDCILSLLYLVEVTCSIMSSPDFRGH